MYAERGFLNVCLMHSDLVVVGSKIQFGKDSGTLEFIKEFVYHGDGKTILNGVSIEGAVANT